MIKELANRLVSCGADKDDAKPSQEGNESAGHSFFSACVNASAENDDEEEVESVKGQGIKAHDRVLLFEVRAICIVCRRKSSGFCANRGKDGALRDGNGRGVPQKWAVLTRNKVPRAEGTLLLKKQNH